MTSSAKVLSHQRTLIALFSLRPWHSTLIGQLLLFVFRFFRDPLFGQIRASSLLAHYSERFEFELNVRYGPNAYITAIS